MALLKYSRAIFYALWLLLGLLQAAATQLIDDEAYYWVYSKFLNWGYFDHPPMIALLIKLGYSIFHNELGVRLLSVFLNTLTILIIEKLLRRSNLHLFYTIVLCFGMLQVGGMLAIPDTPLLFFTALFFYTYRRFTTSVNLLNAVLLGIVISLLFYTKYHGLLVVLFTLLSNYRLLKKKETWVAFGVVILFYSPHILWQWENNWVSFRYHLFESNVSDYSISNTIEYLAGQILLAGPLAGLLLIPAAFLFKPFDDTERAMKFTMIGIYFIFFVSSFRGKVEANWTMSVLVSLIVLSHAYIDQHRRWYRVLQVMAVITFILVIAGRIYMIADIGPRNPVKDRFHYAREWVRALHQKTGDVPVVFYNSYQRASVFWFYSEKPSHSMNDYRERLNNYSFWPVSNWFLGQTVYLADIYDMHHFTDSISTRKWNIGWKTDSIYVPLEGLQIHTGKHDISIPQGQLLMIDCSARIPASLVQFLEKRPSINTTLWIGIFRGKECLRQINTGYDVHRILKNKNFTVTIDVSSLPKGKFRMRFGMQAKEHFPIHNSRSVLLQIE